jgi:hypothetical protein
LLRTPASDIPRKEVIVTAEQLAQALVVAIVTAFAASVLNNFFELRRLQAMWTRERKDRALLHRRQRLEEGLSAVQRHVHHLLEAQDLMRSYIMDGLADTDDVRETWMQSVREFGSARASMLAVGDEELGRRLQNLYSVIGTSNPDVDTTESDWLGFYDELTGRASLVLDRCRELLEEEESSAIGDE